LGNHPFADLGWGLGFTHPQVPAGVGVKNVVTLARSGKTNFIGNASDTIYLHYQPPVVTSVRPSKVGTAGGDIVTIAGKGRTRAKTTTT
jgi:hypothetical protein